jgi:3-oxoacyl-[acyl-carrier-protein] synthase-3
MKYSRVFIDSIGYELPPVVVTTGELEGRLGPLYQALRIPDGQLEALTGVSERRWWEPGYALSQGATEAARKALAAGSVLPRDVDVLIYAGVCREQFEPATACRVASNLHVSNAAAVYDVSNACLGVLNGMIDVANRIELGQVKAGLIVSCESAREITDIMIDRMNREPNMDSFKNGLATMTGGSGAVAVLMTDGSFTKAHRRRLLGGVSHTAPEHHGLCRWGLEHFVPRAAVPAAARERAEMTRTFEASMLHCLRQRLESVLPSSLARKVESLLSAALRQNLEGMLPSALSNRIEAVLPSALTPVMTTDSISVLKHGVDLGLRTWTSFLGKVGWMKDQIDKVICHQVGASHRDAILRTLGIPEGKDFCTYEYLGNMGTVSLPLTAALAEEREFLCPGDRVGFLGIGSGLNCLMLGIHW